MVIYNLVTKFKLKPTMRNPRGAQSSVRAPLNEILGSEAAVRILRAICEADAPLSRVSLAERAGLSIPGTSSAVAKLQRAGILVSVGEGARQSIALRDQHPLAFPVRMLFRSEALRWSSMLDDLRNVIATVSPTPQAAWLLTFASGTADAAPVVLEVLGRARDLPETVGALRQPVAEVEATYDLSLDLRGVTTADIETADTTTRQARSQDAVAIFGPAPHDVPTSAARTRPPAEASPRSTHGRREDQAWLRAAWIAPRLDRDPTLPRRARKWLVHRAHVASEREQGELNEWISVLDGWTIPRIQHLLLDRGERATRLRQSNPFVPVLSTAEREQMQRETIG